MQNLGTRAAEQLVQGYVHLRGSVVTGLESRCQLPGWSSFHSSGYPILGHVINFAKHVGTHHLTVSRTGWTRAVESCLLPITTYLHLQSFKVKAKQNLPQIGSDICNEMCLAHPALSGPAEGHQMPGAVSLLPERAGEVAPSLLQTCKQRRSSLCVF